MGETNTNPVAPARAALGIWICVPHGRTNCPRCVSPASTDVVLLRQQLAEARTELATATTALKAALGTIRTLEAAAAGFKKAGGGR